MFAKGENGEGNKEYRLPVFVRKSRNSSCLLFMPLKSSNGHWGHSERTDQHVTHRRGRKGVSQKGHTASMLFLDDCGLRYRLQSWSEYMSGDHLLLSAQVASEQSENTERHSSL